MKRYGWLGALALAFLAGCILGSAVVGVSARSVVHADMSTLPAIFQVDAQLKSPIGPVEVQEIHGEWIRVKSLHVLAEGDTEHQWMYVPAVPGTWIPDEGI